MVMKFEIDGYTFRVGDDELEIGFDVDKESGMVEISSTNQSGSSKSLYIKRDIAMTLSLWLKSRLTD